AQGDELDEYERKKFLEVGLPIGAEPGMSYINKRDDKIAFSYVFRLKSPEENVRDDLASITFLVSTKNINVDAFEKLFKFVIENLKDELITMNPANLTRLIERIYNGVNENKKVKITSCEIDIPKLIKKHKLNIKKKSIKEFKGELF
ncbi:MAG: hypothetical protein ACTSXU_10905, partial [Promethearchaeota archaeon]